MQDIWRTESLISWQWLLQIGIWSFYTNETWKCAVWWMRAWYKVLIYNSLSICATSALKYLNFQGTRWLLVSEPLYCINVTSHVWLKDPYISMNASQCSRNKNSSRRVLFREACRGTIKCFSRFFLNRIFSHCKCCLPVGNHMLSYMPFVSECLGLIQLHLWWSSMSRIFKWLRCWPSSNQSFDQRALLLSIFLIRS